MDPDTIQVFGDFMATHSFFLKLVHHESFHHEDIKNSEMLET